MTTNSLQIRTRPYRICSLRQIVEEVSRATNLPEALQIIVRRVCETMNVDVCSVYLAEQNARAYVLSASEGLSPESVGRVRLEYGEGLVGLVASRMEPVNVRNAGRHPDFKLLPECDEEPYHGFLGVPVVHRGDTLGVIVIQQVSARRFRDTDVAFLVTLATQLAGVIALAKTSGALGPVPGTSKDREYRVDAIAGAPGVAVGVGVVLYSPASLGTIPDRVPDDPEAEVTAFRAAVSNVIDELHRLANALESVLSVEDRALFDALAMIAGSDALVETSIARIRAGNWAPAALRETIDEHVSHFAAIDDPYLRERARDIRDLGQRILVRLQQRDESHLEYPENTILVAEDLSPVDLAKVPSGRLAGVISGHGSSLSHLSIVARAIGVPAIMGIAGDLPIHQLDAKQLIMDGYSGRLYVSPGDAVRKEFLRLVNEEKDLSRELGHLRDLPAETPDGYRVGLYANAGILADLSYSRTVGAEGIGLYRTELPFMLLEQFPSEEEQLTLYRQVLETFAPQPVTLRMLDVGGDKALPYLPFDEPNPVLGWRGIRMMLDNPVILLTQLRAMLRAAAGLKNLRVLIPMVGSVDEIEETMLLIHHTYQELRSEGEDVTMPQCGAMIEVPSAVYQARELAMHVDFLSIGTNDLTQYLLAVDRSNERVARLFESLHPAVIRAVHTVVTVGRQNGKPVSVCGQAAGDPAMAILLLGMGIHSLSMSASDLPRIKLVMRTFSREEAEALLDHVLQIEKAAPIRNMLNRTLIDAGLGGLVRAGK